MDVYPRWGREKAGEKGNGTLESLSKVHTTQSWETM